MGIFGKIKNVLFTEEEETVEIPVIQEEKKVEEPVIDKHENSASRFSNFDYVEEELNNSPKEEIEVEKVEEKIVEEESKSPFQAFDEEEFDRIAAINKNRLLERDRRAREEKENNARKEIVLKHKETDEVSRVIKPTSSTKVETEEVKRFQPTPVISPVYGILDKNYRKEDILPKASPEGTLPKIMDVDDVRQKAFGKLEDIKDEKELDDIKITSFEDQVDEDTSVLFTKEEIEKAYKEDLESNKEELDEEVIEPVKPKTREDIKKKDKIKKEKIIEEVDDEVKEDEDDLEKDLFNLIDSMYQGEEGEK